MKKTMTFLLALAMIFALAIPAFAQQNNNNNGSYTVDAASETVAPTVTVTMPTGVVVGLNPYGMVYSGATAFLKNLKSSQDQILSAMAVIENKSDVKLSVGATATATVSSGVSLVSGDTFNDNNKDVYLKMQLGEVADKTGSAWKDAQNAPTEAVFDTASKKVTYVGEAVKSGGGWSILSGDSMVAFTEDTAVGKMAPVILAATDGKTANFIGFKFSGAANDKSSAAWTTQDTLSVNVVFTFRPLKVDQANA